MDDILLQTPQKPSIFHRRQSLRFEECLINGEKVKLPQALCENNELFQALFSVDSWNAFTEQQRRHLMQFLPKFEENEMEEKSYTLKLLFSGSEFRFGNNPLTEFGEKLNAGFYQSDIVQMQKMLDKARYKEYLKRQRIYYYKILKHSLVTRHKLLEMARDLQQGSELPQQTASHVSRTAIKRKIDRASLEKRVKHRYYQELISIKKETGDSSDSSMDENYPEGFVPPPFTKKHRKQIFQLEESFNDEFDQPVISTLSRPDCLDLSRLVLNVDNPFDMTEDKYKEMLKKYQKHKKNLHPYKKIENKNQPEKLALTTKQLKELKPLRKRRARKPAAALKPATEKTVELIPKDELAPFNDFVKPLTESFGFNEFTSLKKKFEKSPIKQEGLDEFHDVKPNILLQEQQNMSAKEELAMKEEQDNAVAALIKQEEREAQVNEYISNEEKPSVLLFDTFDRQIKEETTKSATSDYLLTPESYNVALQSVMTSSTPTFKKTVVPEKSVQVPSTPIITEVGSLPFDPLTIDTMSETSFKSSSSPVTSVGVSAPSIARISPSVTDLDNVSVMDLGNAVEETEPPLDSYKPPSELMHNAHSSFFSLIREIVCSTWDHRMDLRNLQKRVDTWYDNAVSPLNSWYMSHPWPSLLQNAVTFLAGHCPDDLLPSEYVPYMEYKSNLDIYQWIGAGRDSDVKLTVLCDLWLKNKNEVATRVVEDESILPFVIHDDFDFKREQKTDSANDTHYSSDWVVLTGMSEEREEFQKQEKVRFQNPTTPFTYRFRGNQVVVGPVNMNYTVPNSNKITKGSSLLVENRPYYVTIMALVQDAAARLTNGEGSRQDIVTLIKDSQYLSENIMNCVLHGAVTSCLEKMQMESDPCVKYDARRKIWVYLHLSRTISDFETAADSVKPKTARKTAVWKLRREYVSAANNASQKVTNNVANRVTKETKINVKAVKNLSATPTKLPDAKAMTMRATAVRTIKTDDKSNKTITVTQPTMVQAVIQDPKRLQKSATEKANEVQSQTISVPTTSIEKGRTIVRAADLKTVAAKTTVAKATRPSIIKKTIIKDAMPMASSAGNTIVKTNVSDSKSILAKSNVLSANTIVKLINAKTLTSDAAKGTKTIAQISPQQIVVIKPPDDGTSTTDKKHTILLKQLQQHPQNQQPRFSLTSLQKCQPRVLTSEQQLTPITTATEVRIAGSSSNEIRKVAGDVSVVVSEANKKSVCKQEKQQQLHQLLVKHQAELKLQQSGTKEIPTVTLQQTKTLPKQMIVVKQNQGQIVAETQSIIGGEEDPNVGQKQITSPLVILNKQQYQQQLQNSKHQIIQLSGQQLTAQQIQQVLMKQQQQQFIKRATTQQTSANAQPQQIVMLKPEIQTASGQQQIVMVKHQSAQPQQQLVMIKQATTGTLPTAKLQQKQPQTQVIQIANNAGIVSPISTDLTKLQTVASTTSRIQKLPTTIATAITQNSKTGTAIGTTIAVSVSKPSMPTYTVVALGQQQKVFSQNNQLQILTSTSGTVNNSQAVVLPSTSGGLTLLQQTPMQQVLLPTGFSSPGMINLKTVQGLKVIPISTQSTTALRGQPVITRLVNSSAVRPVVIQEERIQSNTNNTTNIN